VHVFVYTHVYKRVYCYFVIEKTEAQAKLN